MLTPISFEATSCVRRGTNVECLSCCSRSPAVTHVDAQDFVFAEEAVYAAVINNLELSPSMQLFKSFQLAA